MHADPPAACVRAGQVAAYVPLWTDGATLLVEVGLDERSEKLVLDTGASWTTITEAMAREVGADPIGALQVIHGGGTSILAGPARISRLTLAGGRASDVVVYVAPTVSWLPSAFKGSLGNELLQSWDVDLDLPDGVLAFERPQTCNPAEASWPGRNVAVAIDRSQGSIFFPVEVDGHRRTAALDSGATATTIARGRTKPPSSAAHAVNEYGYESVYRSDPIQIEHLIIGGFDFGPMRALQTSGLAAPDLLIGLDFLWRHRILISYRAAVLFIDESRADARASDSMSP